MAAAAVAAAPGLVSVLGPAASDAPAVDAGASGAGVDAAVSSVGASAGADASEMTGPLVAHVKDLSTGEISLFNGTREIVTHDPQLAGRLYRAAQ